MYRSRFDISNFANGLFGRHLLWGWVLAVGFVAEAAPRITEQPRPVSTKLNAIVEFDVQVDGQEPLTYQWRLNGVNIPGADKSAYFIESAQQEHAGAYSVLVADATGAVLSDEALLLLNFPEIEPGDSFEQPTFLQGSLGTLMSSNEGATRERGEPLHAGKYGDRSVWYLWEAPFDGVATMDTRGSGVDTLLAVYLGDRFGALTALAGDDDNGGARTSLIRFNARKGEQYRIAIDGLGGDQGVFVLNWELEDTNVPVAEILRQPESLTVQEGEQAQFVADLLEPGQFFFQWYFNGQPLDGERQEVLFLDKVTRERVGTYQLEIFDARQRVVRSQPAVLEIGPEREVQSVDKYLELIVGPTRREPGANLAGSASSSLSGSSSGSRISFSVGVGSVVSQTMNNSSSVPERAVDPHCQIYGAADRWITLQPTSDGVCQIDTEGSGIDTVIAVYRYEGSALATLSRVMVCNDDISFPHNLQSRVTFQGRAGEIYWVALDGREGAEGLIQFNMRYGLPPHSILPGPPFYLVLPKGSDRRLYAGFGPNAFPLSYEWRRNGTVIPGAKSSTLDLNNLSLPDSGLYTARASNFAGNLENTLGTVVVDTLEVSRVGVNGLGQFTFRVDGDPGQRFLLQSTSNFLAWTTEVDMTLTSAIDFYEYMEADMEIYPRRFYQCVPLLP